MSDSTIYVGTSGWYYDHWEGILYPVGLAKSKRFEVYIQNFNAVEINATYYRLPSTAMAEGWLRKAPEKFRYAVKAHKDITHRHRLKNANESLQRFLQAISPLKEKLGVILFQLPPSLKKDSDLLKDFLILLPPSPATCFEFRHSSWECDETYEILHQEGKGHVVVSKKDYPFIEQHTADFAYYRLHGPEQFCASSYSDEWLSLLSNRLLLLAEKGITSYVFFNNDIGGHAVHNARRLHEFLKNRRGE